MPCVMVIVVENELGNPSSNPVKGCKLNYHDQKIWQTLMHDIRKHWTA